MNKLSKTATALDSFFKIFKTVTLIACVAALVASAFLGAALLFDLEIGSIGEIDSILQLGSVKLTLADGTLPATEQMLLHFLISVLFLLITSLAAYWFVRCICAILEPMKEGKPFHSTVSLNLKKLAWVQILYGAVTLALDNAEAALMNRFYRDSLSGLLEGSKITHVELEPEADLTFLLIAGVLILLAYIFRYGEELQKLSDETL